MSRKSRRRETNVLSKPSGLHPSDEFLRTPLTSESELLQSDIFHSISEVSDNRQWNPEKPNKRVLQDPVPTRKTSSSNFMSSVDALFRMEPVRLGNTLESIKKPIREAAVCARRAIRREVLHALGMQRTSGGSGGGKRTDDSYVKCFKRKRR